MLIIIWSINLFFIHNFRSQKLENLTFVWWLSNWFLIFLKFCKYEGYNTSIQFNCKGGFWILSPKGKWIKAQRVQYNEFIESGLKTRFQLIRQRSQWTKDGEKAKKNNEKTSLCKEILPRQCPRRVVLGYIYIYIYLLDLVTVTIFSAIVFFFFQLSGPLPVMGFFSFILPPFALSQPSTCWSNG